VIIGNKSNFAIEFGITKAYAELGLFALGFFTIHLSDIRYGVYEPDTTALGCSFDEVRERFLHRGKHIAPFATEPDAHKIAVAFSDAIYAPDQENEEFFGLSLESFSKLFYSNKLMWAPDGDEAFDDGSYILHFDLGNQVRLIGFKRDQGHYHDPLTLTDIYLEADEFYKILQTCAEAIEEEWKAALKRQNDSP